MTKKIGIIGFLCLALSIGVVTAFAADSNASAQTSAEPQTPVSSVTFKQNGTDIQQSIDEGNSWANFSPVEMPEFFTYDELSAWIANEAESIQELVDAGEWTEAQAAEVLARYYEILESLSDGLMVGKRATTNDDQLFFSMPNTERPEQYQTFIFDGDSYTSIGPFDTEDELFNALKDYTDTEVESGTMTPAEAESLLEKYK